MSIKHQYGIVLCIEECDFGCSITIDVILKQNFSAATHVAEICKPLQSIGIIGFFYTRLYQDGSFFNLTSQPDWSEYYFQQLYQGSYQNTPDDLFSHEGVSLWSLNPDNPVLQDAKNHFGYGNGVSIYEEHEQFREITGFYSTEDNRSVNHFYLNNVDILKKFKQHFISKATDLIHEGNKNKLILPQSVLENKIIECNENHIPQLELSQYLKFPDQHRMCVIHKNTGLPIYLTSQRGQCLLHLSHGKSIKKIAIDMRLSSKTVEHYLEILRKELGCRSSKELIVFYASQLG